MKRISLIFGAFIACMGPLKPVFADTNPILDQIQTGLLAHVETIAETTTKGETYAELLATPIQIGRMGNDYLVGIDAGIFGNVAPSSGQTGTAWTYGIHFHLTPVLKKYVLTAISPDYPALAAIELNPRISIDDEKGSDGKTHHMGTFGFAVGFAFGLTPLQ